MKKENIFNFLQNSELIYGSLLSDFIGFYSGFVETLLNKAYAKKCSEKEEYIIKKLEYWLDEEGYMLLLDTIKQLNDCDENKIKGFIDLYSFLLSNSSDSIEKLIDHLFYIPGQFFSEFMSKKRALVGKIDECLTYIADDKENSYTVLRKGIFNEIPFFSKWRISYEY